MAVTMLNHKHLYVDDNGKDVVLALISVGSASELPTPAIVNDKVLHEASCAWDISTGDGYGLLASGSWVRQPNGLPYNIFEEVLR